jgi:uncharacterized membrane protein
VKSRELRLPSLSQSLLAAMFCLAGVLHFLFPAPYLRIIPPFFPAPRVLVLISGLAELLGGIGLLLERVRAAAGIGLIALLICVFPANIYMLELQWREHGWSAYTFFLILRLPLQLVLIRWVLLATRSQSLVER